jgi:hypothetical protein
MDAARVRLLRLAFVRLKFEVFHPSRKNRNVARVGNLDSLLINAD